MMDSIYDQTEAFRDAREEFNNLLEAYEEFNNLLESYEELVGGDDIVTDANNFPKPKKNLFRKGYLEPVFPVRKCARSNLRKKTGRLSRKSVLSCRK